MEMQEETIYGGMVELSQNHPKLKVETLDLLICQNMHPKMLIPSYLKP